MSFQVLYTIGELMIEIFHHLETNFKDEIETVRRQYPCEPFIFTEKPLVLQ